MTQIPSSYREVLKQNLASRMSRNPHYSLRAYARDLSMSAASLSEVLNGKKGLSRKSAVRVSQKLDLTTDLRAIFCDLVEIEHPRSSARRKAAKVRLGRFDFENLKPVDEDRFAVVSEWYHFAILELTHLKDFRADADWIGRKLNIEPQEANAALARLKRLGYLRDEGGKLIDSEPVMTTTSEIPSPAIRDFHKGLLRRLISAIDVLPPTARQNEAVVCAVSQDDLQKIKKLVQKFHEDLIGVVSATKKEKTDVVCVSLNLWTALNENT